MKLRNRKTGKVLELSVHHIGGKIYESLAEIEQDWEDYKEPIEYYRLDCDGEIIDDVYEGTSFDEDCKSIGNYFETKEESEKAVEKLEAWRRLKDKGFRFGGWEDCNGEINTIYFSIPENKWETDTCDDLDICFGGEE